MSWVEHIDKTQSLSVDYNDSRRATRVFDVWDASRDAILYGPEFILNDEGIGLPKLTSEWNGMLLDRYDVQPIGGNVWSATALYSNDGRFTSFSGPNFASPEWQVSFTTVDIPLPFALYTESIVRSGTGQPLAEGLIRSWTPSDMLIRSTIVRYQRRVDIPRQYIGTMLDALGFQNNRLHLIRGYYYHFEAGDAYEYKRDVWSVTYSWTFDKGHRTADLHVPAGSLNRYPAECTFYNGSVGGSYNGPIWARPPYHQTTMRVPTSVNGLNTLDDPTFEAVCGSVRDDLGWSDLPLVGTL